MALKPEEIYIGYPDIKRNGRVFTDGCGHVSMSLAAKISEEFGSPPCSAF